MKNILSLFWILLLIAGSIFLESPIPARPSDSEGFSAERTMRHMNAMASQPHFMGTAENRKVRDYILSEFKKLQIETEVFIGHCEKEFRGYKKLARTENIIATLKGTGSGKAVVLAGHYDSVLSAPGAADDIHAVACMLETARLLKKERPENDIIFLITDGEEMGLLGAKAFVENRELDHIGVLFNYEARGNSGPGIFFEWSDGNAWLVGEMRKACRQPVSNSMAFEIYNKLPNDTDFTHFKAAGIKGINHAFIDGFSYYHNPADLPENINLNSVQHTGENMWRLSRHFGNLDLEHIPDTANASFFNFFGLLVIYPASFDLIILLILLALIGFCLYSDMRNGMALKKILVGFFAVMLATGLSNAAALFLGKLLWIIYPQYQHFYTGQFYNHKWYIFSAAGIAIIVYWLVSLYFIRKENLDSFKSGSLLYLGIASVSLYLLMPTASYLLSIPSLALSMVYYIKKYKLQQERNKEFASFLLSMIPIGIWGPVTVTLFLAFSIKLLFVPSAVTAFLVIATIILFPYSWKSRIYPYFGILLILAGLIAGHLNSSISSKRPLPSSLYYHFDTDSNQAWWVTDNPQVNKGNEEVLVNATKKILRFPNDEYRLCAPAKVPSGITIPSVHPDSSSLSRIVIRNSKPTFKRRVYLSGTGNIKELYLNGIKAYDNKKTKGNFLIDLLGFSQDSLVIDFVKSAASSRDTLWLNSMFRSVPKKIALPEDCVRQDDYTSITQSIII